MSDTNRNLVALRLPDVIYLELKSYAKKQRKSVAEVARDVSIDFFTREKNNEERLERFFSEIMGKLNSDAKRFEALSIRIESQEESIKEMRESLDDLTQKLSKLVTVLKRSQK